MFYCVHKLIFVSSFCYQSFYILMYNIKVYLSAQHRYVYLILSRQVMSVQRNTETSSYNHFCRGKGININYCECLYRVWVIRHEIASFLYCIIFHLWPVWLYHVFPPTISKKGTIFEKKRSLKIKCIFGFSLQLLSLILRRI